jgi:uncharacterized membrane protein
MITTAHPLVDDYLGRLEHAARPLPRHQREELVAEIRAHLDAGLGQTATEAEVRNLLNDLGEPADIVAAAQPDPPAKRPGTNEIVALILLVTGFPPFVGWLAGAVLLVRSPLWSADQKVLGLLVWPGGYVVTIASGLALWGADGITPSFLTSLFQYFHELNEFRTSVWLIALQLAVLLVPPLLVAAHLYRVARRQDGDR